MKTQYSSDSVELPSTECFALLAATLKRNSEKKDSDNNLLFQQTLDFWESAAEFLVRKRSLTHQCEEARCEEAVKIREELKLPQLTVRTPFALLQSEYWPNKFPASFTTFARFILKTKSSKVAFKRIRPYINFRLKKTESFRLNQPIEDVPDPSTEHVDKALSDFISSEFDEQEWNRVGIECLRLKAAGRSKKSSKAAIARHSDSKKEV